MTDRDKLDGIGGWLRLFLILLVGAAFVYLSLFIVGLMRIGRLEALYGPTSMALKVGGWIYGLVRAAIPLVVAWRLIRVRRWHSIRFAIAALWLLWLGLPLLDLGLLVTMREDVVLSADFRWQWGVAIACNLAMAVGSTAYLLTSRRVAGTYPTVKAAAVNDTFA